MAAQCRRLQRAGSSRQVRQRRRKFRPCPKPVSATTCRGWPCHVANNTAFAFLCRRRYVALHGFCAVAKKMRFHLAGQVLAGAQISQVQPVFVH